MGNWLTVCSGRDSTPDKTTVKLKGQWLPGWYLRFLGWHHEKQKLIFDIDGQAVSPYMLYRQKAYERYCAQLYNAASKIIAEYKKQESVLNGRMSYISEKQKAYLAAVKPGLKDDLEERRINDYLYKKLNLLKDESENLKTELEKVRQAIRLSLFQTEEERYAKKLLVEAQLLSYVQGAKRFHGANPPRIPEDPVLAELYRIYCGDAYR